MSRQDNLDPGAGETLDAAIAEALAPLRPDPEDFAAGVRERIEEAEESGGVAPLGSARTGGWLRSAAAYLPPFLLPREVAETTLLAGGLAVKKSAWKLLPGAVAFPAIVVFALLGSFVFALRRAAVGGGQEQVAARDSRREIQGWWTEHRGGACVAVALLIGLLWYAPVDALVGFMMVSMLAMVGLVGALSRVGLASRAEVGLRAAGFQLTLLCLTLQAGQWMVPEHGPTWTVNLLTPLFLLGIYLCRRLALQSPGGRERDDLEAPVLRRGLTLSVVVLAVFSFFTSVHQVSRTDAVDYVAGGFEGGWSSLIAGADINLEDEELAGILIHLESDGGPAPSRGPLVQELRAELARQAREGDGSLSLSLLESAASLGIFDGEDARTILSRYAGDDDDLENPRPVIRPSSLVLPVVVRTLLGELTEEDRDRIANRLVPLDPERRGRETPEDLTTRTLLLDLLERGERAGELAVEVERVLVSCWSGGPGLERGAFARFSSLVDRDDEGRSTETRPTSVWLDSTDHGVRLLDRFGVPAQVDLSQLSAYLRDQSTESGHSLDSRHVLAAALACHVAAMDPDYGPASPWQVLVAQRLLLSVGLLVALCVFITLRAPHATVFEHPGAGPGVDLA